MIAINRPGVSWPPGVRLKSPGKVSPGVRYLDWEGRYVVCRMTMRGPIVIGRFSDFNQARFWVTRGM